MTCHRTLRRELIMWAKLTCFGFSIQTTLQMIPILPSGALSWSWIITSIVIVAGCISDVKFYAVRGRESVKSVRFAMNLAILATIWSVALWQFRYLKIPYFQDKDKEVAEVVVPGMEARILNTRIFEEFGEGWGMVLLMMVHFTSVAALVSVIRVGMLLVEFSMASVKKVIRNRGLEEVKVIKD